MLPTARKSNFLRPACACVLARLLGPSVEFICNVFAADILVYSLRIFNENMQQQGLIVGTDSMWSGNKKIQDSFGNFV